jgi:hypothetical protein
MTDKYRLWQGGQARMIHSKLSNFNTIAQERNPTKAQSEKRSWGQVAGKAVYEFDLTDQSK